MWWGAVDVGIGGDLTARYMRACGTHLAQFCTPLRQRRVQLRHLALELSELPLSSAYRTLQLLLPALRLHGLQRTHRATRHT
eukprot:COSAG01_NODE_15489_length_1331_cov_2.617695_1_plen_82_part_00